MPGFAVLIIKLIKSSKLRITNFVLLNVVQQNGGIGITASFGFKGQGITRNVFMAFDAIADDYLILTHIIDLNSMFG